MTRLIIFFAGVTVTGNGTFEKPLSTTAQFSPSPFLGVIPEQQGSLVIGEVFQDTIGPRHKTVSFPTRPVQEYAHSRETHREYDRPGVEIHIGPGSTGYGRPDYETPARPYGKPEVDITVPTGYGGPDHEVPQNRPHSGPDNLGHKDYPDISGYSGGRPKQPFYEGYENMKNLLKPGKVILIY